MPVDPMGYAGHGNTKFAANIAHTMTLDTACVMWHFGSGKKTSKVDQMYGHQISNFLVLDSEFSSNWNGTLLSIISPYVGEPGC